MIWHHRSRDHWTPSVSLYRWSFETITLVSIAEILCAKHLAKHIPIENALMIDPHWSQHNYPEFSRPCRCCSSQVVPCWSYFQIISSLAKSSGTYQNKLFQLFVSFSSFHAHSTFVIPSPYSLHVLLGHQTWSLSSVRQFSHVSRLRITNRSFRHTAPQL